MSSVRSCYYQLKELNWKMDSLNAKMDSFSEMFRIEFDDNDNKTVVFSTSKTLHERFAGKQRCVFVINNGYTAPYKNNKVNERIIIQNRMQISRNKLSHSEQDSVEKSGNEYKNKLKRELRACAKKRRVVLMPTKLVDEDSPVDYRNQQGSKSIGLKGNQVEAQTDSSFYRYEPLNDDQMAKPNYPMSQARRSKTKRCLDGLPKGAPIHHPSRENSNDSDGDLPIVYSPFLNKNSRYYQQSLYKWRRDSSRGRRPITKEELDKELDIYMSETVFKTQSPAAENDDAFVEEYMIESEKYCYGNDSRDPDEIFPGE